MPAASRRSPASRSVLRIGEVMTCEPVCIERGATLREVARLLEDFEFSGAPVVDEGRRIIGVVSKNDVLRRCLEGMPDGLSEDLFDALSEDAGEELGIDTELQVVVDDFMSTDLVTAREQEAVTAVARRMAESRVHRAIVVDDENCVVGIVTSLDLLGVFGRA